MVFSVGSSFVFTGFSQVIARMSFVRLEIWPASWQKPCNSNRSLLGESCSWIRYNFSPRLLLRHVRKELFRSACCQTLAAPTHTLILKDVVQIHVHLRIEKVLGRHVRKEDVPRLSKEPMGKSDQVFNHVWISFHQSSHSSLLKCLYWIHPLD